jgi:pimeloyl-ACP methyl ester carboxylesterase
MSLTLRDLSQVVSLLAVVGSGCKKAGSAPDDVDALPLPDAAEVGNGETAPQNGTYVREPCGSDAPPGRGILSAVECGRLHLTSKNSTGTVSLPVLRLSPSTGVHEADPVIVVAGGPGQSATSLLSALYVESPFFEILGDRDVIALGARGTPGSAPDLTCLETNDSLLSSKEVAEGQADSRYRACRTRLGNDGVYLGEITSEQNALDVIALVRALSLSQWSLYAMSYGTRTALEVLRVNAAGLRAVVLDSPVPMGRALVSEAVLRSNEVLMRVLGDCAALPTCNAAFPDIITRLEGLLDGLAAQPVRRRIAGAVWANVDESQALAALHASLGSRAGAGEIPRLIARSAQDISTIDPLVIAASGSVAEGVYLSTMCREVPQAPIDPNATPSGLMRKLVGASREPAAFSRVCGIWNVEAAHSTIEPSSEVPTLILGGELDPVMPPQWLGQAGTRLGAAQRFAIPGEAHTPGDSPCGSKAITAFLNDPASAVSLPCLTTPRPLQFAPP